MTTARQRVVSGTAAWLRALFAVALLALALPALAMAQDGGQTTVASEASLHAPPPEGTQVTATEAPAPMAESTATTTPPPAVTPEPIATALPPAEPAAPVVPSDPLDTATQPPSPPPASTPAIPPAPGPAAAPELAELVPGGPGAVAPSPPPAAPIRLPATPVVAPAAPDLGAPAAPSPARVPGTVAQSLGKPAPPPVSIGAPEAPSRGSLLAGVGKASDAALASGAAVTKANDVSPLAIDPVGLPSETVAGPAVSVEPPTVSLIEATSAASLNVAPSGSSLLAVLASYALPGGSGAPASTLVLFIVIGLILLVAAAPRPGLSERVVASGLLGASSGHRLAVRRPG